MCGRFYVDDEMMDEIGRICRRIDGKLDRAEAVQKETIQTEIVQTETVQTETVQTETVQTGIMQTETVQTGIMQTGAEHPGAVHSGTVHLGDVHPSEAALILRAEKDGAGIVGVPFYWGYEAQGKLIFNARCETVRERPLFRRDYESGRCVVPARRFYEWKAVGKGKKEQYNFYRTGGLLFLAGICHPSEGGGRFTLLTTEANSSVKEIHGRMPVLLEEEEISLWLREKNAADRILERVPALLERKRSGGPTKGEAYSQLSLF